MTKIDCEFKIIIEEKGKRKEEIILKVYGNYDSELYNTKKLNEKMVFVARKI